jgi:hypothetical protein
MPLGPETAPPEFRDSHFIAGDLRLAVSYWLLYFGGACLLFFAGSWAVDSDNWVTFIGLVALQLAYTFVLVIGIRNRYRGPQKWKVISRTSSVFMIINILVGISTLGFVY